MKNSLVNWDLVPNFVEHNFSCKCGCGLMNVEPEIIYAIQEFRDYVGHPVYITSGSRCPAYNKRVGGVHNSEHTLGQAIDVVTPNSRVRKQLIEFFMKKGVTRFGVYPRHGFVHIGYSKTKPQDVMWVK